jgi:hypothetical protein
VELWALALIVISLLATAGAFIWLALRLDGGNGHKGGADAYTELAEQDVEHIFNDEFREELRNRGRLHFEKIIGENAMFLQQDLRLTTSQLNEYMKTEITRKLQEEFSKYEESITDAKQLAIDSITKTQQAIEEQRKMMSQQLSQELANEKIRLVKRFEENMADIINHYVLAAIGDQIDLNDQLEYILTDKETATLAINAALTGHLVLSTLHTNSAAGAVPRLIDMGIEPFLLASVLQIVVGQRLVRGLCADREAYTLSASEVRGLDNIADLGAVLTALKKEKTVPDKTTWNNLQLGRPKQSAECVDGYKGRQGIHEVLTVTPSIKEMMLKDATTDNLEALAKKEGMLTMIEDGLFKCAAGHTSVEEVLRVVSE